MDSLFFLGVKKKFITSNISSGIVQSPQGCSRVVSVERSRALTIFFFCPLFLNFLDPTLIASSFGNFV